jgi:hypothetical protein
MRRILEPSLLLSTVIFTAAAVAGQTATDAIAPTQGAPDSNSVVLSQVVYSPKADLTAALAQAMPGNPGNAELY